MLMTGVRDMYCQVVLKTAGISVFSSGSGHVYIVSEDVSTLVVDGISGKESTIRKLLHGTNLVTSEVPGDIEGIWPMMAETHGNLGRASVSLQRQHR
jgi:hypothetical protein